MASAPAQTSAPNRARQSSLWWTLYPRPADLQAARLSPSISCVVQVFAYGHDTYASLDPHCGIDDLLRVFAAGKLGGFPPLLGPDPTLGQATQIGAPWTTICGAVYDDQEFHGVARSIMPAHYDLADSQKFALTGHESQLVIRNVRSLYVGCKFECYFNELASKFKAL